MSGFEFDKPKGKGTNRYAVVECKTCSNGDRVVLFSTRANTASVWMSERGLKASGESEEYAPCPSCNDSCDTRRPNHRSPDPAKVRERLSRQ